jgi:hypothetical protein
LSNLTLELSGKRKIPEIFNDNQPAQKLAKNSFSKRTKHLELKYHFIREAAESNRIKLEYCPVRT